MKRPLPAIQHPASLEQLTEYVRVTLSPWLESFFLDIRGHFRTIGPDGDHYWDYLRSFAKQGKLSRPLLYFATLLALTGRLPKKDGAAAGLGLMVEITHFTSLLIDDFIDRDAVRRNETTFHEFLKSGGKSEIHQSGVVSGTCFILLGALRNFLQNLGIPARKKRTLLDHHNTHEQFVACGFMKELEMAHLLKTRRYASKELSLANFRIMTELKTGILIREPLLNACIMVGYSEKTPEYDRLKEFGTRLGIAYQIRDDIIDLFDETQKQRPMGSDIRENKPNILTILALLDKNAERRALFIKLLEQCRTNAKTILFLKNVLKSGAILDRALQEKAVCIDQARAELEALKNETRSLSFSRGSHAILDHIVENMENFTVQ